MLTGENMFPWADKVIFNSVAFLDVNFLNPADGSLFRAPNGEDTALANVILKVYGSVMTLSIGLLGVIVGIMAIRLAFSVIASEKAKYKEAIVKFATTIVMIFCIHYAISIIFYVNEKLVEIASTILLESITENNLENALDLNSRLNDEKLAELYVSNNSNTSVLGFDKAINLDNALGIINGNEKYSTLYNNIKSYLSSGRYPFDSWEHMGEYIKNNNEISANLIKFFQNSRYAVANGDGDSGSFWSSDVAITRLAFDIWVVSGRLESAEMSSDSKILIDEYYNAMIEISKVFGKTDESLVAEYFNENIQLKEMGLYTIGSSIGYASHIGNGGPSDVYEIYYSNSGIIKWKAQSMPEEPKDISRNDDIFAPYVKTYTRYVRDFKESYTSKIISLYKGYAIPEGEKGHVNPAISNEAIDLISSLGNYFKESVWSYKTDDEGNITGWRTTNFTVSGAILYAIFVIQSIMFFFAYIKRFFYVTILALMAPLVIIYDFLIRAIM